MKIATYLQAHDLIKAFEFMSEVDKSCRERRVNISVYGPEGKMDSLMPVKEKLKKFPELVDELEKFEKHVEMSIRDLIKSYKDYLEKQFETLKEEDHE